MPRAVASTPPDLLALSPGRAHAYGADPRRPWTFSKAFKGVTGLAPSAYRLKNMG